MSDTSDRTDDSTDLTETLREDPPRIPTLDSLAAAAHYCLGTSLYIHEVDYYADGQAIAYLGVTKLRDTQDAAQGDPELTAINIAPIGAIIAEPAADGDGYVLDLPDRDDLSAAVRRREQREAEHRMAIIPALKNLLEDRQQMHYEAADEYGIHDAESLADLDLTDEEWFHVGREIGMMKMASLAHRVLTDRLRAAYRGRRRWDSPAYRVSRDRRTTTVLEALNDD